MASRFLKYSALLHKYRTPLLLASCSGVFAVNMFYHVCPDLSYRQLYQAWHKGEPVELSEKLNKLFQQVLTEYGSGSPENFSAFASFGFHPVGAGVPWLPAGAQIGIPANFNSTSDDLSGITNRSLFVNGKTVDWASTDGTALREALVLSLDAQKFAIAREVARLDTLGPVLNAAVAPFCLGGMWVYNMVLKGVFRLPAGALVMRGVVNIVTLGVGAISYYLISEAVNQWIDHSTDKRAAKVSPAYAKGGVEFYDKLLSRNRTLRSLMGQKGLQMYAPSGNLFPSNILQLKYTPYTSRRDNVLALVKEQEKQKVGI